MKQFFLSMAFFSIFAILSSSCTRSIMTADEPESTAKSTIRATDGREALAQMIAAALNNDDAAIELQNMITLERDGDREVLLAEIIPSPNDLRSSSPLFGSLQGSFSDVRSLRAIDHSLNLANYPTFESFAEALIAIDPLVEVAVAGPDNIHTEIDLTDDNLLVTYLPENFDDQTETTISAYDKNGNIHYISSSEEPSNIVVVIRHNERLVPIPKGPIGFRALPDETGALYHEGEQFDYHHTRPAIITDSSDYTNDDHSNNGSSNGNGGTSNNNGGEASFSTCDRALNPTLRDQFVSAKFASKKALWQFEPWILGRPEIRYTVTTLNGKGLQWSGYAPSDYWGDGNMRTLEIDLFNWKRNLFGDAYHVFWVEEDNSGLSVDLTPEVTFSAGGAEFKIGIKISIKNSDDQIGATNVIYTDPCLTPYKYSVGSFAFWIGIVPEMTNQQ